MSKKSIRSRTRMAQSSDEANSLTAREILNGVDPVEFDQIWKKLIDFAITLPTTDPENFVQAVFLSLLEKNPVIREPRSFWAYVRTAMRRRAIDHWKPLSKRDHSEVPFIEGESSSKSDFIPTLECQEEWSKVAEAICQLEDDLQLVVYLKLEGLTNCQIAEEIGVTDSTVGRRLAKAITRLRVLS